VLLIYDDDQHRSEDNEINGTHSFSSMLMMLIYLADKYHKDIQRSSITHKLGDLSRSKCIENSVYEDVSKSFQTELIIK